MDENGVKIFAELGAMRLSRVIYERLSDKEKEKYGYFLLPDVTSEMIDDAEFELLIRGDGLSSSLSQRLHFLAANSKSDIALALLELTMLRIIEPQSVELMNMLSPGNDKGVTLYTAALVSDHKELSDALLPLKDALKSAEFLLERSGRQTAEAYAQSYQADPYLLSFLSGAKDSDLDDKYTHRFNPGQPHSEVYGFDEEIEELTGRIDDMWQREQLFTVLVEGDKESGRFSALTAVSDSSGMPLIVADFGSIQKSEKPAECIRRIVRSCALESRALCLRNVTQSDETAIIIEQIYESYRDNSYLPLLATTDLKVKLKPLIMERYISMKIPSGETVSYKQWKGLLPDKYKEMAGSLSSKMKLKAGQIKRVCTEVETLDGLGENLSERRICRICYEILDDGRYDNVKWVAPGYTMEDLKVDDRNRAVLEDICNQVTLRGKVFDDWKMKERYAYGKCISVILAGPPGTGKTMAVHALASRLGLELYKVDLSQIADKYIGETEKRLEEVFAKAEKSNMILFFDEADAVMAKRSDVKDSHDKYANTEISFILQRIEEYDGIVILATNNLQNIDSAFMRRIRYVVHFALPGPGTREGIWREAFGRDVPLDDAIDFEYLAETFEFSGGDIKNIVLNSVFYAASESDKVRMDHIMKAVYRELTKGRNVTLVGNYGKYSYMLRDGG